MVGELIDKYIWLLDTIVNAGSRGLSLGEIASRYQDRYDAPYPRRSFNNHRSAILEAFGITKQIELPFSDLRGTFVSTLTDMEADAESFGKEIGKTLIEQMMDKLLEKNGFRFSKALGQNFLIDRTVPERIAYESCADERSFVLEVGPGVGCLTEQLSLTRQETHPSEEIFILSGKKKPLDPQTFRRHFREVSQALGFPQRKIHSLRHTFATRCVESKCDLKTLSSLLGHADITTTMNLYVHPGLEQKRRCVEDMMKLF